MRKVKMTALGFLLAGSALAGVAEAASCIMNFRADDGSIKTIVVQGDTCTLDQESGACACT